MTTKNNVAQRVRLRGVNAKTAVNAWLVAGLAAALCTASQFSAAESHGGQSHGTAYRSVVIIEPEANQRIARPGKFSVITDTDPDLQPGHRVQLFIDGYPHRIPNMEGRFSVPSAASGQHDLQVKVIDQGGGELAASAVRTIVVE